MARAFNGSSQYLSTLSNPGPLGNSTRSLCFWVQTTAPATRQFIFYSGDESGSFSRFCIEIESSKFAFNYRGGASYGTTTPMANTWYHVAYTYDGATNRGTMYVNGSLEQTGIGGALSTGAGPINLGRVATGSLYLSGKLAEFALWNVALTADEVNSLAKALSPSHIRPSGIVAYMPLIREIRDTRGLAVTDNGPTTFTDHPRMYY